jgi:hypothetical protein
MLNQASVFVNINHFHPSLLFASKARAYLTRGFTLRADSSLASIRGGVKTERVFPGLSVLRKNKKMEVLYPEK